MTSNSEQHLSDRFEVAFNQVHSWLKKNNQNAGSDKFTELLRIGFSRHSLIRRYYHDLKMFAKLRNSIVHNKIEEGYYIAEPHEDIVKQVEEIAAHMLEEKEALAIATKPVFFYYQDAKLSDVLTVIQKLSYSIFPVYDENGFQWLLTSDCIIQWFAEHVVDHTVNMKEVTVQDLAPLKKSLPVEFAAKTADVYEIEELFEKYLSKNNKLYAVIVTETGQKTEKPLGIVTSWDLVEIE